ncbi:MAG: tripartite tricarboxylate transporter TctB family protein [Clostridiaceae bacterium]|nr:tripartite tricarboxylate transporter TctB family protein [Clostridiaceae bacterium]
MNQYKTNIVTSVFFIIFGIAVWNAVPYCIRYADTYSMGNELLTSYFMPRVLVVILVFNSAVNLLINLTHYLRTRKNGSAMPAYAGMAWAKEKHVLVFAVIMLVYAAALTRLGFILSSAICCSALLLYVRDKKPLHYAIVIAFIMVMYLVFTRVLYVKLP